MNRRRLWTLIRREVRATFRDPFTVGILIGVPLIALLAFSFVISSEVHGLHLAVLDGDHSPESRRLVADLGATPWFVTEPVATRDEITRRLRGGTLRAALIIPPDFARDLRQGRTPPEIQLVYDGAETVLAGNAEGALRGLVAASGARLVRPPSPGSPAGIALATGVLFNPRLEGTPFMVAGTFGFVLSFLTTLITAVTIVNERLSGTFDQLQVTPATSLEILLGKLLPLGAMFAFDVLLMMLVSGFVFGVWPAGSAVFFLVVSTFYVLLSLALGLIFSATSDTAAEAVQKTVLFSIPLIQLSGFAFPIRNMPRVVQWVTQVFPATHYIRVSRGIYLRGEGPLALLPELLLLGGFGIVLLVVARRTLETRA
jgi:ABC-2 type transport system permease protein